MQRAQGTIEYLLIIAVIVIIGLIVVGLTISMVASPSQQLGGGISKANSISSPISIMEAVVDSNGDGLFSLQNNTGETITIIGIKSEDGKSIGFDETLPHGAENLFYLTDINQECPCTNSTPTAECRFIVTYATAQGLTKTEDYTLTVNCVADAITAASTGVIGRGTGTLSDPFIINSLQELQDMRNGLDANYALGANLDAAQTLTWNYNQSAGIYEGFLPIGEIDSNFTGTFDGKGHTISGLYMNSADGNYGGVFGQISKSAKISNLHLEDLNVNGQSNLKNVSGINSLAYTNILGGLVGVNHGEISNCSTSGKITSYIPNAGGLVGLNYGTISASTSSANATSLYTYDGYAAGLCAVNRGVISNSSASGDSTAVMFVGGLAAWSNGTISNSHSSGKVLALRAIGGGLVGSNSGSIIDSYAIGDVNVASMNVGYNTITAGDHAGGLVGRNIGSITESYASGKVDGNGNAGGLAGFNNGSVSDSYALGDVNGSNYIGGLVGYLDSGGSVLRAYSIGDVNGIGYVGGLVGVGVAGTSVTSSFSTGRINRISGSSTYFGGLISTTTPTLNQVYWFDNAGDFATSCYYNGTTNCTLIDASSSGSGWNGITYFKDLTVNTRIPMSNWSFDANWTAVASDYPKLKWQ
ncbi:MAG: GLUG motif-containing protein [archaeon]